MYDNGMGWSKMATDPNLPYGILVTGDWRLETGEWILNIYIYFFSSLDT